MLSKTRAYVKSYDGQAKCMYFLIEDEYLLKKYHTNWDKFSRDIKKEFDSKPVYSKRFFKTKIKPYSGETTYFQDKKKFSKVSSDYTCLNFTLKKDKKYYP